ncbi:hypothetical protein M0R45_026604 [Rubus argutus]|uniref:Uncharacterized protein n=1 Tax=Rubus argutus TaxID=59490 RepID=A0AAW1WZS1_RUBAR
MKKIAVEPQSRVQVEFTASGEPFGEGSVSLSSYLGPLVREHVPVTLDDWRGLGDDIKVVLWESIQARFNLDEEWQKLPYLNQWDWKKFIREKTSPTFTALSDKFKTMRHKQIPHTCSRKGMARLGGRYDGKPVNIAVAETIDKLKEVESDSPSSSTTNVREDALSQVLGKDKPGRLRAMGRGMTISKLAFIQSRDKHMAMIEEQKH